VLKGALAEIDNANAVELDRLLLRGGFPEPYLAESDATLSPGLRYFHNKYSLKAVQVVKNLATERMINDISLRRATSFLKELAV
jgi:hypothetical protein